MPINKTGADELIKKVPPAALALASPSRTTEVLRRAGWRFIRDLGQNFLVDANVLAKIIEAAALQKDDAVLEIGAGIGTLTLALADLAEQVVAVEIDPRLTAALKTALGKRANVKLVQGDAVSLANADTLFRGRPPSKLVANLPYGVAATVILRGFAESPSIQEMTVMVQREIAERVLARPGDRNYAGFTAKLGYFCQAKRVMPVSRSVFLPKPNVDSTVIKLTRRREPPVDADQEELFSLITAGFSQRRKKLVNAISGRFLGINKDEAEKAMRSAGISESARAEELDLVAFANLLKALER